MLGEPWAHLWVAQFENTCNCPKSTVSGWRYGIKNAYEDEEDGAER